MTQNEEECEQTRGQLTREERRYIRGTKDPNKREVMQMNVGRGIRVAIRCEERGLV